MTDERVAGFRPIRVLAEDAHSWIVLARACGDSDTSAPAGLSAIKRFARGTNTTRILNEIECLDRAQGTHVLALDDVAASNDDVPIIITAWEGGVSLRRILRMRQSLRPGEAITLLAPVLGALTRAHRAGVSLGELSVDSIYCTASGRPYLAEFGDAQTFANNLTPTQLRNRAEVLADRRAFSNLASRVLNAVRADQQNVAAPVLDWLAALDHHASVSWTEDCEAMLFSLGAPEPVRLGAAASPPVSAVPSALRPRVAGRDGDNSAPASDIGAVLALPLWLHRQLAELARAVADRWRHSRTALRALRAPVRRRTWAVAAVGALAAALAAAVLVVDAHKPGVIDGDAIDIAGADETSDGDSGADDASVAGQAPAGEWQPTESALLGDPLDALTVLVDVRSDCLRELSSDCLLAVAAPDSPAFAADSALIREVVDGGEFTESAVFTRCEVVDFQRVGDTAMVVCGLGDNSEPASILLVKGEAGWRIRSYALL